MFLVGAWVGIFGYAVMYAGIQKLAGDITCTLGKAMRGQCGQASAPATGGPAQGVTRQQARSRAQAVQFTLIGAEPLLGAVGM